MWELAGEVSGCDWTRGSHGRVAGSVSGIITVPELRVSVTWTYVILARLVVVHCCLAWRDRWKISQPAFWFRGQCVLFWFILYIFSGGLCSYWLACFTLKSSYRHIDFVSFFLSSSSSCSSFHSFFPFVFAANWKCLMPHWHLVWPHWNVVYATHTHWNMYPLPYIVVTAQELC